MFHLLGEFCCTGTIRSASQSGVRVERPRSIRGWMAPWVGQTLVVGTKCHHAPLNLTVPDQIVPNHVCTIPDQLWSSKCHQNPSNLKYPTIPDQTVPLVLRLWDTILVGGKCQGAHQNLYATLLNQAMPYWTTKLLVLDGSTMAHQPSFPCQAKPPRTIWYEINTTRLQFLLSSWSISSKPAHSPRTEICVISWAFCCLPWSWLSKSRLAGHLFDYALYQLTSSGEVNIWIASPRVMLWDGRACSADNPSRLICNQFDSTTSPCWKCAINHLRTFYLAQLHHSRNYGNRQNLMTAPTFNASEENSVKSAKQERALPRFHFLDNNGDELAEHCWPPKDRRCKRLTDPLLPFQPTCTYLYLLVVPTRR